MTYEELLELGGSQSRQEAISHLLVFKFKCGGFLWRKNESTVGPINSKNQFCGVMFKYGSKPIQVAVVLFQAMHSRYANVAAELADYRVKKSSSIPNMDETIVVTGKAEAIHEMFQTPHMHS